jgi:hypothetical protein
MSTLSAKQQYETRIGSLLYILAAIPQPLIADAATLKDVLLAIGRLQSVGVCVGAQSALLEMFAPSEASAPVCR